MKGALTMGPRTSRRPRLKPSLVPCPLCEIDLAVQREDHAVQRSTRSARHAQRSPWRNASRRRAMAKEIRRPKNKRRTRFEAAYHEAALAKLTGGGIPKGKVMPGEN